MGDVVVPVYSLESGIGGLDSSACFDGLGWEPPGSV